MLEDFGDKALVSATAVLLWRRELRPAGQPNARPTASEVPKNESNKRSPIAVAAALTVRHCSHRNLRDGPLGSADGNHQLSSTAGSPAGLRQWMTQPSAVVKAATGSGGGGHQKGGRAYYLKTVSKSSWPTRKSRVNGRTR